MRLDGEANCISAYKLISTSGLLQVCKFTILTSLGHIICHDLGDIPETLRRLLQTSAL
jgi:hypothetical protein